MKKMTPEQEAKWFLRMLELEKMDLEEREEQLREMEKIHNQILRKERLARKIFSKMFWN